MPYLFTKQNLWLFLILITSLFLFTGEVINGRFYMHDFEVYYKTANRFLHGQELYRLKEDGHFVFKYSPTSAFYFIPLSLLPYSVANVVFWFLLIIIFALTLYTFYKLSGRGEQELPIEQKQNTVLLLTFLTAVTHLHRELHLGQVNLLLLALYVFMLQNLVFKKYKTAGFLLATSLFIKPFGLIFLPYFFLRKKAKALFYTLIFVGVLSLVPLLFYPGLTAFKHLYINWFQELAVELKAKQSLLEPGNHTIFSVVARYTPLQYLVDNAIAAKVYQLTMLALIGISFLFFIKKGNSAKQPIVAEGAILICLIPLFAVTSMNAFLFAVPCVVFLLSQVARLRTFAKVMLAAGCVLLGGNNYDLVGRRNFMVLEDLSVYTFGAILILGLMYYLRFKKSKLEPKANPEATIVPT
ncbi:glycosyltransferase family 87 protein [Adhaeribacter aquaticus]|uniref:glycosyltransferase family 87 protein n=1 Tax=Adhaeribacter aquaticus TaxID=299567 RepID=UPI00146FAE74|nr:glycosyltransferase family 87 protein [Adhaeribacter aquaticus]